MRITQLFFLVIILLSATTCVRGDTLRAGFEVEPPYHFYDANKKVIGTDANMLRESLAAIGVKVMFNEQPWKRTLYGVEHGEIDIAIGAKYTDARAKFAYYSLPYKRIEHSFFVSANSDARGLSLVQFLDKGHLLGIVRGWGYPPALRRLLDMEKYKGQFVEVTYFKNLPNLLDKKRVMGIIANPSSLASVIGEAKVKSTLISKDRFYERLHFLFSKKSVKPEIVAQLNASLTKLIDTGRRDEIFKAVKP